MTQSVTRGRQKIRPEGTSKPFGPGRSEESERLDVIASIPSTGRDVRRWFPQVSKPDQESLARFPNIWERSLSAILMDFVHLTPPHSEIATCSVAIMHVWQP